ncbi:hypothetical protein B0T19DRAFT_241275 [Cercophora scortea]|uniref:Uncharacterized protein n=1 Tax=Cercophora scortea TaxID=314031 RepID=A0AAE0M781_9PEZI|nr:hypothetical protein B0T19DRAFT_241275 [Cercophora scortea]
MLGKILLTLDAVALLLGAPAADYNHTHIFNPRWPPHAKFHGGQTITLSLILGLATLYYTWRSSFSDRSTPTPLVAQFRRRAEQDSLRTAALLGSIYWLAGLVAVLYPGAEGIDPEFGTGFPQGPGFAVMAMAGVLGWALERKGGQSL